MPANQKLTGYDLHVAYLVVNAKGRTYAEQSTVYKLQLDQVAQGLNIQLATSGPEDILYVFVADSPEPTTADIYELIERKDIYNRAVVACNEDDTFTLYMIQGGRLVGEGWYKMLQSWAIEIIAEYGQAQRLGTSFADYDQGVKIEKKGTDDAAS